MTVRATPAATPTPPRSATPTARSGEFSAASRAAAIAALARTRVEILVVGGGITGAGIARDAALRGMNVALIEREDFGAGTSSRSSRLVHGGLRYLEHGHLRLVFEASRERHILTRIAPHLVRPLEFTWPVYAGARVPRWKLRAGLMLYDALALFRNLRRHRMQDADALAGAEPELRQHNLQGGAAYYDASTDDARLTLANARAASAAGAIVANHVALRELLLEGDEVVGAIAVDTLTGHELRIRASLVVNATGPWSDEIVRLAAPRHPLGVRGTKGVHVAVPRDRIGNRGALTLVSPIDGRVFFVLPAGELATIGTTETDYAGPLDDVRATPEDITYLLRSVNAFFPAAHLTIADVVSAWAGVRPLLASEVDGDFGAASREHDIEESAPGLLSVTGGKLTTYRAMAAQTVGEAMRVLGYKSLPETSTHRLPLPGGDFGSLDAEIIVAREMVGHAVLAMRLVERYGAEWRELWELVRQERTLGDPLGDGIPYIAAEAVWAVEREMALTLADILVRRLHVAYETRDHGLSVAPAVAGLVAPILGWSAEDVASELAHYEADVLRMFGVEAEAGA